jgi:hypothetical protein
MMTKLQPKMNNSGDKKVSLGGQDGGRAMGNQALFGRGYLVRFLERCAVALSKREILNEQLMPDGRYRVLEQWPSREAFEEVRSLRVTFEAMRLTSRNSDGVADDWG